MPQLLECLLYWRHSRGKEKGKGKEMRYRVFPDVNKIGRQKAVTFIPILLGHNRQLRNKDVNVQKMRSLINKLTLKNKEWQRK